MFDENQIIVLLFINIFSAAIHRQFIAQGKLISKPLRDFQHQRHNLFVIAGFWNQSDRAFQYVNFEDDMNLIALNFSAFGYNPKNAGQQIARLLGFSDQICAISVGAKAVEYSIAYAIARRIALICPCSHPSVLKPFLRRMVRIFAPVVEVVSFALGWLAFLPVVPIKLGGHASITLIADQLFWIAYGNPVFQDNRQRTGLVMSYADELLRNKELERIYQSAAIQITVEGLHARTDIPEMAEGYESAIKLIFS